MAPLVPMSAQEKTRLRAAAYRAKKLYPGPVGEVLYREIEVWYEFGYRFGGNALIGSVVDQILKTEIPPPPPPRSDVGVGVGVGAVGYE